MSHMSYFFLSEIPFPVRLSFAGNESSRDPDAVVFCEVHAALFPPDTNTDLKSVLVQIPVRSRQTKQQMLVGKVKTQIRDDCSISQN